MTNERAIELLNRISDSQFDGSHGDERREALELAVRALEQNLVKESGGLVQDLVKDCISRQAIMKEFSDFVRKSNNSDFAQTPTWNDAVSLVGSMPSAQIATDTNVGDTISRQAVIDAVAKAKVGAFPHDAGINNSIKAIKALPSAQPERKKGKWIKISPANIYECSECGKNVMTDDISAYDFCHGCGADMRTEGNDDN